MQNVFSVGDLIRYKTISPENPTVWNHGFIEMIYKCEEPMGSPLYVIRTSNGGLYHVSHIDPKIFQVMAKS